METYPPGTSSPNTSLDPSWEAVLFKHDRMYKHNVMRINYTTYDVRRDEDVIHAGSTGTGNYSNIMTLAPATCRELGQENRHPFWYARVMAIYHVNVVYIGEGNADFLPRRLDFLWVRWYELLDHEDWSPQRLDRVSFMDVADEHAFGFLDPDDVLRACHIIPAFREGLACDIGPGLTCCAFNHDHTDWKAYIVNR